MKQPPDQDRLQKVQKQPSLNSARTIESQALPSTFRGAQEEESLVPQAKLGQHVSQQNSANQPTSANQLVSSIQLPSETNLVLRAAGQ